MDEYIIVSHICIVCFHSVAIFFCQTIVPFNTGAKWFESFVNSRTRNSGALRTITVFETCVCHPAKTVLGISIGAVEQQLLRVFFTGMIAGKLGALMIVFYSFASSHVSEKTQGCTFITFIGWSKQAHHRDSTDTHN